jgi:hypothetical protein
MLNLPQIIVRIVITLVTMLKLVAIIIIAQSLILFLFVILLFLRGIANFLRLLLGEE